MANKKDLRKEFEGHFALTCNYQSCERVLINTSHNYHIYALILLTFKVMFCHCNKIPTSRVLKRMNSL